MSPTEDDLRAALRDGEGDGVEAGAIIVAAQRRRRERRRLVGAIAAACVVVAGVGVLAAPWHGADRPHRDALGAPPAHTQSSVTSRPPKQSPSLPSRAAASSSLPAAACPARLDVLAPTDPNSANYHASGRLFAAPVTSILVCRYGPANGLIPAGKHSPPLAGAIEVSGSRARKLADVLQSDGDTADVAACLIVNEYAFYATAQSGAELAPVTAHGGCMDYLVSNGRAARLIPVATLETVLPVK